MAGKPFAEKISVPENYKGYIIGKQHAGLKEISERTGADVFLKKSDNEIYAKGTPDQVEMAKSAVQKKLKFASKKTIVATVKVPEELMGKVIGKGRRNIRLLEDKSKTRITYSPANGSRHPDEFRIFRITGPPSNCEQAKSLIQECIKTDEFTEIKVPREFIGRVIGRDGINIRRIETESQTTTFLSTNGDKRNDQFGVFKISGPPTNCEQAKMLIRACMEGKNAGNDREEIPFPKEFVGLILGKNGSTLQDLKTKSGTRIWLFTQRDDDGEESIIAIEGKPENRKRAKSLLREKIISAKEGAESEKLGGDKRFVYLNESDKKAKYFLKPDDNGPKLNGFMKGQRYRIKTVNDDDNQADISEDTISSVKDVLLKSLQRLHQLKDELELNIDLWCHYGKVFVHNVGEGSLLGIYLMFIVCGNTTYTYYCRAFDP